MEHSKVFTIASWALRLIAAVILLQTLFFKFSGARESVYIFSTLGLEPWGRIGCLGTDCGGSAHHPRHCGLRRRAIDGCD